MHCQFGDHYFKKKERKSSRVCIQGTRKIGCQAHVEIREYILYPEYSVNVTKKLSAWKRRTIRESKLEELQMSLKTGKEVKVGRKYFLQKSHQTHLTGGMHGMAQKVHPHVAGKIRELVSEGGIMDPSSVS